MPHPHRVQVAGGVYHVATRATGPSELFRGRDDRTRFLRILKYSVQKHEWLCHLYCLMVTHYHLVVTTPRPNIAAGMQLLNSLYARTFNEKHGRIGHLVASRYSGRLIESEGHALEVCRYVPLNPVRSGLCDRPERWYWSSYGATVGLREEPTFLNSSWVLQRFAGDYFEARRTFREFVEAGLVSETLEVP
jgi:REP element-mobilizing transposase RayT